MLLENCFCKDNSCIYKQLEYFFYSVASNSLKLKMVQENSEIVTFTDTSKLLEDISSLYLNERFSDLIIKIDDQNLHAHKVILACRSDYFQNLLYGTVQQNEITITDISPDVFRNLLKYIYTGSIAVSSDIDLTLEVLGLAHQHSFKNLESGIISKLKSIINLKNICSILNTANMYDLEDLQQTCYSFMDSNASEVISTNCFTDLTQKSMVKLLQRDTFFVPELEIFKKVAQWCQSHNDVDGLVIQSVRLSWLSVEEIVSTVWSSKLVDCESLLNAIAEIVDVRPKTSTPRALLLMDENVATPQHKAEVVSGTNTSSLLTGNRNVDKYAHHPIDGKSIIVVRLKGPTYINHIYMMLWDKDKRSYSYYVEVSIDQKKWIRVIDYSKIFCRSYQNLYFEKQIAQYIRIVGTHNTDHAVFHLVFFEAYLKSDIPKIVSGIIVPNSNVATPDKKALVITGANPDALLNGDTHNYDGGKGFTYHTIGVDNIVIQLAQPYIISSMKFLLWDGDSRSYRYLIETSVNKNEWKTAIDKRNEDCKSWQNFNFKERAVVFVRITGTHNTNNEGFHIVHFECPAENRQ